MTACQLVGSARNVGADFGRQRRRRASAVRKVTQLVSETREARLPRSTDIHALWHGSQYASLAAAVKVSALLTSVTSEQLVSAVKLLYADIRSKLNGDNVEKLLLLASVWFQLLAFSLKDWMTDSQFLTKYTMYIICTVFPLFIPF